MRRPRLFGALALAALLGYAPAATAEEAGDAFDLRRFLLHEDDGGTVEDAADLDLAGRERSPRRWSLPRRRVFALGAPNDDAAPWLELRTDRKAGVRASASVFSEFQDGGWRLTPRAGFGAYTTDGLGEDDDQVAFRLGMDLRYDFANGARFGLRVAQQARPAGDAPFAAAALATISLPLGF